MATGNITNRTVSSLSVPAKGRNFLWDCKLNGFGVYVTPSGHRSYVLQYRVHGRPPTKRYTIGRHGSPWTPRQARARAYGLLWTIAQGVDPMEEKKSARAAAIADEKLRFKAYLETFIRDYVEARNLRTVNVLRQVMNDWILPAWSDRLITDISKKDFLQLFDKVSLHSKSTANHVFDWLRTMMNFARSRSDIEVSPLDNLKKHKLEPRNRVLTDPELQRVWEAAHDLEFPASEFLKWLILSSQRSEEVRGMRWEELDLERRVWVIPKERAKNKKAHLVPLTPPMLEILDANWPQEARRGLVFKVGQRRQFTTSHLKVRLDDAVDRRVRLAAKVSGAKYEKMPHFMYHDLRRTCATGLQKLGIPIEHTEALLNHAVGSTIQVDAGLFGVYHLYKYEPEKRRALLKWHAHISRLMSQPDAWPGGKVLP